MFYNLGLVINPEDLESIKDSIKSIDPQAFFTNPENVRKTPDKLFVFTKASPEDLETIKGVLSADLFSISY